MLNNIEQKILNYFIYKYRAGVWRISGDIAERFHNKDSGEYDDLQEKFYSWITRGLNGITKWKKHLKDI